MMKKLDFDLVLFFLACFLIGVFFIQQALADKKARVLYLSDDVIETIWISPNKGVVLSFPLKPTKATMGSEGHFAIEYVESDLVIGALRSNANTYLHVYLQGRRYSFHLVTSTSHWDGIVQIKDKGTEKIEVQFKP